MRRLGRVLAAVLVLAGLAGAGVVCQRVAARGRFAVAYSTYGAGAEGARGVYLLAQEERLSPSRWAQDLAALPSRAMIVALGGCDAYMGREVSRYERQALERWIDRGGVLVVAGAHGYLWKELGVTMIAPRGCAPEGSLAGAIARAERGEEPFGEGEGEDDDDEEDEEDGEGVGPEGEEPTPFGAEEPLFGGDPGETFEELTEGEGPPPAVWSAPEGELLAGLGAIPLRRPATIAIDDDVDAETILRLPAGPAGVILRRGEGAVVVLASASPFQNRDLAAGDGGVLLVRLARALAPRGPLIFDEYHLGVGERRSLVSYLRTIGGGPAMLQVLVIVALVLWRLGARFGPPRAEMLAPPAGTASYVAAVGALYDKSADVSATRGILVRHALRKVAAFHHIEASDPARMAKALDDRGRKEERAAVERLGTLASSGTKDKRSLVADAREIDALVERATRRGGQSDGKR